MYTTIKKSIENAKKEYDNKYNEKIVRLEKLLIDRDENIWNSIEKKINHLHNSFDIVKEEMITKFRNELQSHKFEIKNFIFNTNGTIEIKKNGNININFFTEEKEVLLVKYETEIKKYYTKFVETRKENLGAYLKESRYMSNNLDEIRRILINIKNGDNDVYFMDILPIANYINKMNVNIIEKYEFILKKINLYEIQTKEDFEKKYNQKIIKLYYSLNKDYVKENETIINIIKNKIIDKLFFLLI